MKGYKKGVYRTSEILGDADIDVIVFDGNRWWVVGWEVGLSEMDESKIKELLWEWDEQMVDAYTEEQRRYLDASEVFDRARDAGSLTSFTEWWDSINK